MIEHEGGRHATASVTALLGMGVFFVVERWLRHANGGHPGHQHGGVAPPQPAVAESASETELKTEKKETSLADATTEANDEEAETPLSEIKPVGWLNLIGDALHNLTDGAIVAIAFTGGSEQAFRRGAVGWATVLAVFLHEVPQELADFTFLLHSGFSRKRALFANFLTALTALVGVMIGLIFSTLFEEYEGIVLAFTAGGFIYIALADMMPEMNNSNNKVWQSVTQTIALAAGVGIMLAITLIEGDEHDDHDEHEEEH